MKNLRRLTQTGDTIVEVMVVLAVLGLAIGVSFATANSSLLATRSAEDNSQATEYLQSQIEALRYLAPSSNPTAQSTDVFVDYPGAPTSFCITGSGTTTDPYAVVSATEPSSPCSAFQGSMYSISASYDSTGDTFTLIASWPDLQGQGNDTATLSYRVHQ